MKRSRLKPVSPSKRREHDLFYRSTQPLWLEAHPECQFDLSLLNESLPKGTLCGQTYGCKVHHMMRRGKYLNDVRFFMTVCLTHHILIEKHKKFARMVKYILYK
jgi:hypothetical protein